MLPPNPPTLTPNRIPIKHMHPSLLINRLRLLIHQPRPPGNLERHNPTTPIRHRLPPPTITSPPAPQIRNHLPLPVPPQGIPAPRLTISIAQIMVILRPVRPRLHLVLRIQRIIPPVVVDEPAIDPRYVQSPATINVHPVDVRVALDAGQVGADEGEEARRGGVGVQVVVAETGLAVPKGDEEGAGGVVGDEARVGDVVEVFVGGRKAGEVV